jgi:hypothetical protein
VNVPIENESGFEGSDGDNTSNGGAATRVKVDKTPTLGQFTGNPGGETNFIGPNTSV